MTGKKCLAAALALLAAGVLAAAPQPARAQNDQTVVIGYGLGLHSAGGDDIRGERTLLLNQIYVEWYALDRLGFGLRRMVMIETGFGLLALGGFEVMSVTSTMVTVNFVVLGEQEYTRLGLLAGLGPAKYEYDGFFLGLEQHVQTKGMAGLAGAYVDWGAEGFGGRLGLNAFATDLDDVQGESADASGTMAYLDLRYAF